MKTKLWIGIGVVVVAGVATYMYFNKKSGLRPTGVFNNGPTWYNTSGNINPQNQYETQGKGKG